MKKIYQFIFIAVNTLAVNTFAQTNACNELFISEIVYAKDNLSITGNSPLANSYAIELFNPKGTEVNLSDYSIKMYSTGGNETIIPLSGNITSKGTFVLGFTLSDEAIIQIAEMLSTSLDFTRQNSLELWGPNGLIDRVGDINISEADAINIAAAIADPVNYLNTLNLNLGSLTNLVARRKTTVVEGDPNFVQPSTNWTIAPNGDVSNLGTFQNVCADEEVTYEFFISGGVSIVEGFQYNIQIKANGITNPDATHSVDVSPIFTETDCISVFNTYPFAECSDVNMNFNNNCNSYTANFAAGNSWVVSFTLIAVADNEFESPEVFSVVLNNPIGGSITPDSYYSCKDITIGASTSINKLRKEININAYPNPFNEVLNISNNSGKQIDKIEIVDIIGQSILVKNGNTNTIEATELQNGVYFIKYFIDKNVYFEKVIKN